MTPHFTRLPADGPWTRYRVTGDDPTRYVVIFVLVRDGKPCIDHTVSCRESLHAWPEVFEGWQGYRDIPDGFDLTELGRGLLAKADEEARAHPSKPHGTRWPEDSPECDCNEVSP